MPYLYSVLNTIIYYIPCWDPSVYVAFWALTDKALRRAVSAEARRRASRLVWPKFGRLEANWCSVAFWASAAKSAFEVGTKFLNLELSLNSSVKVKFYFW